MVTGYGIYVFTLSTGIVRFLLGVNPYRDCAEIVRKSCNVSAVAVQSPQPQWKSFRARAGIGLRTVPVRARKGIVQCHLRHVYGLITIFSNLQNFSLNQISRGRGARESVRKSHSRLLPPQGGLDGGRTERGIRTG